MNNKILAEVENHVGWITLNRPEKLNALSSDMIEAVNDVILDWKDNDSVWSVVIKSSNEKAFCAGGDIREILEQKENKKEFAAKYFTKEYSTDYAIHNFGKPVIIFANGIVFGGGVGIEIGATHRIIEEKSKWAMPEMDIGLFTDVGSCYFFNKMPGYTGRYIALTAAVIKPADILYTGAADYFIPKEKWNSLETEIKNHNWTKENIFKETDELIKSYNESICTKSELEERLEDINEHFKYDSMEEIVRSLKGSADNGDEWAEKILGIILKKSPTSLKIELEQLRRGKGLSVKDCFIMQIDTVMNIMNSPDFNEGVRATLIDKDKNPQWSPDSLEKVESVESYFSFTWENGNPLRNIL